MTWLDEIEEKAKGWSYVLTGRLEIKRMARVLRELITIHPIIQEAVDFGEIGEDYIEAFGNWYESLSDDARELVEKR